MQASKSREDLADFDTFQCLSCQTVIRESKPQPADGGRKPTRAALPGRGYDQIRPVRYNCSIKNNH